MAPRFPDAKVTVAIKDRGGVITRTDALGAYRVPGFGKEINPTEVLISCEKPGYKQVTRVPAHGAGRRSADSDRDRMHDGAGADTRRRDGWIADRSVGLCKPLSP